MSQASEPQRGRPPSPGSALGELLRHWRGVRGRSQLDLSTETGISQRHISFIESGRSQPGRQTLLHIARSLDVPLRDRNALLLAAGYAPLYPDEPWNTPGMASVMAVLNRMLRQHDPFPALVMDRYWDVVLANDAAPRFFCRFVDLDARGTPRNLLHLMFDPAGMRPFIANWNTVAWSLLERVRREAVGHVVDQRTKDLVAALLAYSGANPTCTAPDLPGAAPIIPLSFVLDGCVLNYFSMVATVGTPQAVAAQELRVECMLPADDETDRRHRAMMANGV